MPRPLILWWYIYYLDACSSGKDMDEWSCWDHHRHRLRWGDTSITTITTTLRHEKGFTRGHPPSQHCDRKKRNATQKVLAGCCGGKKQLRAQYKMTNKNIIIPPTNREKNKAAPVKNIITLLILFYFQPVPPTTKIFPAIRASDVRH